MQYPVLYNGLYMFWLIVDTSQYLYTILIYFFVIFFNTLFKPYCLSLFHNDVYLNYDHVAMKLPS